MRFTGEGRQSLKPDGSWMIVEPMGGDRLEDNLNPIGRLYYGASKMVVCRPHWLRRSALRLGRNQERPSCGRSSALMAFGT